MALRFSLAALAAVLLAVPVRAQGVSDDTPLRPATRAAALTNARVVVRPGRVLDRATVVVRDGRIVAVGEDAEVPYDARVIEADSFTVYAGFVDAFGYEGIADPDDPERYEGDRGDPPRELAGIVPDRDVRTLYDPTQARIGQLRNVGFTAAHVAPRDGLLAGQGAVVLLRDLGRGEHTEALVLTEPISVVAQLDTAPGVYPSTPMGVLAVLRETVENARRRRANRTAYDDAQEGAARPRYDPTLDAVEALLDDDRQFVFVADGWLDGFRALRASEDMALAPVLAGIPDAAPLADRLRQTGAPVFAPLALPDTIKADSSARALDAPATTPGGVSFISNRRTFTYEDTASETATLTGQRLAAIARTEASPGVLAQNEIPFAFATFDVKPGDVYGNLRRMIKAGLSTDDALTALTVTPATLLGLDRELGTVERGKLANLVVTTGDLFSDSTEIRHVFVEGVGYEIEGRARGGSAPDSAAAATALGTWSFTATTPEGDLRGSFTITQTGGALGGSISQGNTTDAFDSVSVDGSSLTAIYTSSEYGEVTLTGTISADEFTGVAEVAGLGSFPLTATRQPE